MICSRCGHQNIPSQSKKCPNCQFELQTTGRTPTSTGSFRALTARRKMLTQRHYALPFALGDEAFGRFKIRDLLGQGPMAVVYQVTDDRGDLWALKLLNQRWRESLDFDTFKGTFLQLDDLNHDRINVAKEVLSDEKHVALLNPFIEGLTFRKVMTLRKNTAKAFNLSEVQSIFKAIYKALVPLHDRQIAHGGLKPENFFVSADQSDDKQKITLSDACLGQAIGLQSFSKAQRTSGLGHCVAPEISQGQCNLSADIFSLGTFIFEALTGQMTQVKKPIDELIPFEGIGPLKEFLDRSMHIDANQRFQHIQEMYDAFQEVCTTIQNIEGSPFATDLTNPKAEVVMITNRDALITAPPQGASDPLISVVTPPPLPSHLTSPGSNTEDTTRSTPPPFKRSADFIDEENTLPTAHPIFGSSHTPPPTLDPLSSLRAIPEAEVVQLEVEPFHQALDLDLGAMSIPAQPTNITQSTQAPTESWFLNSRLGFLISALLVVSITTVSVQYLLKDDQGYSTSHVDGDSSLNHTLANSGETQASTVEQTAAEKAAAEKAAAEKAMIEKAMAEKAAAEKAAVEKVTAEKAAAEQAAAEQAAAEQAAAEQAAAEKAAAEQAAAEKAAAEKAAAEKAAAEQAAAEQAAAEKAAAKKAAAEKAAAKKATAEKAAAKKATQSKPQKNKTDHKTSAKKSKVKRDQPKQVEKSTPKTVPVETSKPTKKSKKTDTKDYKEYKETAKKSSTAPSKGEVKEGKNEISCPTGMIVKTTARFPRKSIKRGKIKGKRAVALAKQGKAYCIDAFEYPGRGQRPKVNVTFAGAQALCSQVNKRLCTDREWIRACKGKRGSPFPYSSRTFNPKRCNTEDADGEERRVSPAGRFKLCRSPGGTYDMSGNVAEWTANKTVRGGYYASADEDAACTGGGRRSPSSKRLYIGFRCCADFK